MYWQGAMELPTHKGSVKLLMKTWESTSALTLTLAFQCLPAPRFLTLEKTSCGNTKEDVFVESVRADVTKAEPLGGPCQTETFPITVKELQSQFEGLGGRKVSAHRFCS